MQRQRKIALTALELDREHGQAHAVLGWIAFYYDWDWATSEQHYRRALAIDSQDFSARLGYAHLLSNTFARTRRSGKSSWRWPPIHSRHSPAR